MLTMAAIRIFALPPAVPAPSMPVAVKQAVAVALQDTLDVTGSGTLPPAASAPHVPMSTAVS